MTLRALAGKRIVITRPPHKAESFAARLRELGAEPILLPTIAIRPPTDPAPLDQALRRLARYDWIVFTSANTVEHLWRRFDQLGLQAPPLEWPAIAVIGPATAAALEQRGVSPALVAGEHTAGGLADALEQSAGLEGKSVLLPQGNLARPALAERLRAAGASVATVVAYENVRPELPPAALASTIDAVTFTSSSTVQHFVQMFEAPLSVIGAALVACIGPVTAQTARACGLPIHVIAHPHTVEGLISALADAFERKPTP